MLSLKIQSGSPALGWMKQCFMSNTNPTPNAQRHHEPSGPNSGAKETNFACANGAQLTAIWHHLGCIKHQPFQLRRWTHLRCIPYYLEKKLFQPSSKHFSVFFPKHFGGVNWRPAATGSRPSVVKFLGSKIWRNRSCIFWKDSLTSERMLNPPGKRHVTSTCLTSLGAEQGPRGTPGARCLKTGMGRM